MASLETISKTLDERNEKRYAWIRYLLLLASGSLSVLISFNKDKQLTCLEHILFSIALLSLGLGILFGVIYLYVEVDVLSWKVNILVENIKLRAEGKDVEETYVGHMPTR